MSGGGGNSPPQTPGRRKDGKPYKENNTREDGSYAVGRNRTPVTTRFAKDDGRKRGRRTKGTLNADTQFERELNRKTVIRENGKERRVSKSEAVDLRLIDNATRKGDNKAIEMIDQRRRRIAAEKEETARRYHNLRDVEIMEQYLLQRSNELNIDPKMFGDPEPEAENGSELAEDDANG